MKLTNKAAFTDPRYLLLLGFPVLAIACRYLAWFSPLGYRIGHFLSTPLYSGYILVSLGLLWLKASREPKSGVGWWPLDMSLCALVIVQGLKAWTRLPRPSGGPSGFPSGHTTYSFGLAWLISQAYPRLAPFWFAIAIGIGWSRVETGTHFTYQVLTGAVLGSALAWLTSRQAGGMLFPRCLKFLKSGRKSP